MQFLLKKSWATNRVANVERVWAAEQAEKERAKAEKMRAKQVKEEAAKRRIHNDQRRYEMSFMYDKPPGLHGKKRDDDDDDDDVGDDGGDGDASSSAALAVILAKDDRDSVVGNQRAYEKNENPLGYANRRVKCFRCGRQGHRQGERECPLLGVALPRDNVEKQRQDPMSTGIIDDSNDNDGDDDDDDDDKKVKTKMRTPKLILKYPDAIHGGYGKAHPLQQMVEPTMEEKDDAYLESLSADELKAILDRMKHRKKRKHKSTHRKHKRKRHKHHRGSS